MSSLKDIEQIGERVCYHSLRDGDIFVAPGYPNPLLQVRTVDPDPYPSYPEYYDLVKRGICWDDLPDHVYVLRNAEIKVHIKKQGAVSQ